MRGTFSRSQMRHTALLLALVPIKGPPNSYKQGHLRAQKRTFWTLFGQENVLFLNVSYTLIRFCHNKLFRMQNYWLIPEVIVTNIEIAQIMYENFGKKILSINIISI